MRSYRTGICPEPSCYFSHDALQSQDLPYLNPFAPASLLSVCSFILPCPRVAQGQQGSFSYWSGVRIQELPVPQTQLPPQGCSDPGTCQGCSLALLALPSSLIEVSCPLTLVWDSKPHEHSRETPARRCLSLSTQHRTWPPWFTKGRMRPCFECFI